MKEIDDDEDDGWKRRGRSKFIYFIYVHIPRHFFSDDKKEKVFFCCHFPVELLPR